MTALSKKKTMHSCSASSGKPDSDSLECIVFSCFLVYHDWNRWSDEGFTFLVPDVSISWGYLLVQMPLWQSLYLHWLNIRCCRYFFWDRCIRNLLFFKLADIFHPVCHVQLHLHLAFSMPCRYSLVKMCILNLLFLCFTDTPHQNFASLIPKIHYLRYLPQYPLRC